ncbi:MAG: RNA polymerase sigma factor [Candidatus Baltobacteraceae bacterium]
MTQDALERRIEAIWRIESPKLIATLARTLRDIGRAEEIAQDAFVAAVTQWPGEGIPRNPGAWLMTAGKRRAIDFIRRESTFERKSEELVRVIESHANPTAEYEPDEINDDMLRLMFISCHPLLPTEARVALTLRLLGGLTTAEIARAFLSSEATIAQRIVRAKRALLEAEVPFEVPEASERDVRLASVLEVLYLIFNEGYSATAGDDVLRPELVEDALRLGRVLASLMPDEPEVHGLLALMEIQASRSPARVGPGGDPILLLDQDRGRWNHLLIRRGLSALERAERLSAVRGSYTLQAAIAACHARAGTPEQTDWKRIAMLYDLLARTLPSPVIELNRAVAVGMAFGPQAGLDIVTALLDEPSLEAYHLLPSVHADLLFKLRRMPEAQAAFERAASLARNARDKKLLLDRAGACRF